MLRKIFALVPLLLLCVMAAPSYAESKLLDFYADWCGPCRTMTATVDVLAQNGYTVERVNIEERRDLAAQFGVTSIPCFVIIENGREVDRVVGVTTSDRLTLRLRKPLAAVPAADKNRPHPAWRYERREGMFASVVRIECQMERGAIAKGSGAVVRWGSKLAVLTARHVVNGARRILVYVPGGRRVVARVATIDRKWDCAVLVTDEPPPGVVPAEIEFGAAAMQRDGDRLTSCGFGSDEKLAANTGVFQGYRRSSENTAAGPDDWMVISGPARQGDSGGPVFNARGKLVGVLWGTDGQKTVCVQAGRVHLVLKESIKQQPQPPVVEDGELRLFDAKTGAWIKEFKQQSTAAGPLVPVVGILERSPTPPLPGPEPYVGSNAENGSNCDGPSCECTKTSGGAQPILPYRRGLNDALNKLANQPPPVVQTDPALTDGISSINGKLDGIAGLIQQQQGQKQQAEEPKGLIGKVKADVAEVKEKGLLKTLRDKMDDFDGVVVVVGILATLLIIWMLRHGKGIHALVEKNREKLESDAQQGGIKGKIASDLLALHDGPIGQKLAALEAKALQDKQGQDARLADLKAKAETALHAAGTVAGQVAQVALSATPVGPAIAAANAAKTVAGAVTDAAAAK